MNLRDSRAKSMVRRVVSDIFPRHHAEACKMPVWCVTLSTGACLHRFFDTSPISPSGRYLALFRMEREDRLNLPGERGWIVLVDLEAGSERVLCETRGWEPQLGANLQWGANDRTLCFNDVDTDTWDVRLVRLDPVTGKQERVPGGVYQVSPDGRFAATASLERMCRTQYGYGVRIPDERIPRNIGAPEDDGLFITDLRTGKRKLVLSLADAARHIPELAEGDVRQWEIYGFHCKWNPPGDRLMFVVRRFLAEGPERFNLVHRGHASGQRLSLDLLTLKPDGSDVHNAVPAERWRKGGHHMNWFPDGRTISMNLGGWGETLSFARVDYDGANLRPILDGVTGSGHPTVHARAGAILTDAYPDEPVACGDGTVPLRWIRMDSGRETELLRIGARVGEGLDTALRVDPHPAWDRTGRWIVFNGVREGEKTRRVFVADMRERIAMCGENQS